MDGKREAAVNPPAEIAEGIRWASGGPGAPPTAVPGAKEKASERIWCMQCGKSVSSPVPKDTIVRAWVECPECIEQRSKTDPALDAGKVAPGAIPCICGIGRTTLYRWLKEAGLSNQDDGGLRHEQLCALKRRTGQMNPADTETLIKAIHAECNRVRRVIPDYESRVSSPGLARDILLLAITQAEESIASGDVARMVTALESLRDCAK